MVALQVGQGVHGVGKLLHSAQAQLELQAPLHKLRAQLLFRTLGFLCFHSFCGARVLGRFCLSAYEAELCKVRAGPYADRYLVTCLLEYQTPPLWLEIPSFEV